MFKKLLILCFCALMFGLKPLRAAENSRSTANTTIELFSDGNAVFIGAIPEKSDALPQFPATKPTAG